MADWETRLFSQALPMSMQENMASSMRIHGIQCGQEGRGHSDVDCRETVSRYGRERRSHDEGTLSSGL